MDSIKTSLASTKKQGEELQKTARIFQTTPETLIKSNYYIPNIDTLELSTKTTQKTFFKNSLTTITAGIAGIFCTLKGKKTKDITKIGTEIANDIAENSSKVAKKIEEITTKANEELTPRLDTQNKINNFIKNLRSQPNVESIIKKFNLEDGKISDFEILIGTQSGSNKGYYAINKATRELFYAKESPKAGKHWKAEYGAIKLYEAAGIDVPELTKFSCDNGTCGILSKFIPDLKNASEPNKNIYQGFGMDALIANWDLTGPNFDNILTNGQKTFRIDAGSCFDFRAQGGKKLYKNTPIELTSLLNPKINSNSAYLFENMTREDMINSLQKVADLKEATIEKCLKEADCEEYYEVVKNRQDFIKETLKTIKNLPQNSLSIADYMQEAVKLTAKNYTPINTTTLNKSAKNIAETAIQKIQIPNTKQEKTNLLLNKGIDKYTAEDISLFEPKEFERAIELIDNYHISSNGDIFSLKDITTLNDKAYLRAKELLDINCTPECIEDISTLNNEDYQAVVNLLKKGCSPYDIRNKINKDGCLKSYNEKDYVKIPTPRTGKIDYSNITPQTKEILVNILNSETNNKITTDDSIETISKNWKKDYIEGKVDPLTFENNITNFLIENSCDKYKSPNAQPMARWMEIPNLKYYMDTIPEKGEIYEFDRMQSFAKTTHGAEIIKGNNFSDGNTVKNVKIIVKPKTELTQAYDIGQGKYGADEVLYKAGSKFKVLNKGIEIIDLPNGEKTKQFVVYLEESAQN